MWQLHFFLVWTFSAFTNLQVTKRTFMHIIKCLKTKFKVFE